MSDWIQGLKYLNLSDEDRAEIDRAMPTDPNRFRADKLHDWFTGGQFNFRAGEALYGAQDQIANAGIQAIPGLLAGTTAEGIDSGIGSILRNSTALSGAGTAAAGDYLSSVGLGGRSAAAAEAGRVTDADAFAIEDELNRRRQGLAGIGMTGMGVQNDMTNAATLRGKTSALYNAQRKAQERTQQMNMLGGLIGAFGGMNFGGGGMGSPGSNISDYTGSAMQNWVARQ